MIILDEKSSEAVLTLGIRLIDLIFSLLGEVVVVAYLRSVTLKTITVTPSCLISPQALWEARSSLTSS
jgi:hypothetical protein